MSAGSPTVRIAARLFGGHVGRGPEHGAVTGQDLRRRGGVRRVGSDRPPNPRDAPVEHQHFAELPDHDVLGLQIAMDDAERMGEGHGFTDAEEHRQALVHVGDPGQPSIETLAAHPLHRVEQTAVGELTEVVDRDDAGMFEAGEDARFLLEPRGGGRIDGPVEHLQGDVAIQRRVAREIYDRHAAAAEDGTDLVARAGEIGFGEDAVQAVEGGIGDHRMFQARASFSNSSSVAHCSRSTSTTRRRNSRRAAASSLVTCVTGISSSRASTA